MTLISEKRDVQDHLITYLTGIGWTYLPPDDVLHARGGDEGQPFLPEVLRSHLLALNPGLISAANVDEVVRRLRVQPASMAGNERYLLALRGTWTVHDPKEQRERILALVDFEHPERNTFRFTQELRFVDRDARRMDMALWINGLEEAVAETIENNLRKVIIDEQPVNPRYYEKMSALLAWYRRQLQQLIPPLVDKWEPVIGVTVAQWRVRQMKARWGTCNPAARRIWLNLELVKKPPGCLEYVVVHEMVHLLERRHNAQFKAHMDRFLPQWPRLRDELNQAPLGHATWGY